MAFALALSSCSSGATAPDNGIPEKAPAEERAVFVVLGGDETLAHGVDDSLRNAWTRLVFQTALPRSGVYVNLASEDALVRSGLDEQLPEAVRLAPTIATVWFGREDADRETTDDTFTADLTAIVEGLQRAGTSQILLLTRTDDGSSRGRRYAEVIRKVADDTGAVFVEVPGRDRGPVDEDLQDEIAAEVEDALAR